jgi:hypothetical protein
VDPLIKSQLLYQLSYTPIEADLLPAPRRGGSESNPALENVLKKVVRAFFDSDMLQLFDFELRPYRSHDSI